MNEINFEKIKKQTSDIISLLINESGIKNGDMLIAGCSTSEIVGSMIGSSSNATAAQAVLDGIWLHLEKAGVYLAAQCCEHLNRAIVIEREAAEKYGLEEVNVLPRPEAGGAFASAVYEKMDSPIAVESISAHAGIDIGGTLIGMHLRRVAVPVKLPQEMRKIGEATIICARTRPKYTGGPRAQYRL